MRLAIIDAAFPLDKQASRGLAAHWLAWELDRCGKRECTPEMATILLVTCVDPRQADYLQALRRRYPSKVIVAGGAASTSPHALGQQADMVCVGDGQEFLARLLREGLDVAAGLPNVWIDGETRVVQIDQSFPWHCPPIKTEDGAVRLWAGRGCKKRCLFCQTGWGLCYSEHPQPQRIVGQAKALLSKGERVAYLSNDLNQQSFARQLPATEHGSYSVDYIRRHGLPAARTVRLGVEGVSTRLRNAVGKPIKTEDLVNCTSWLNANGKGVRWFLIAGLPGERDEDWQELRDAVQVWKRQTARGVLGLSFTAFLPQAATPLAVMPLEDDYWPRFEAFREWFFGGQGWSNRVKIMAPAQSAARMHNAIAAMGLDDAALRLGGDWGPNDRVVYPYKVPRAGAANAYAARMGLA